MTWPLRALLGPMLWAAAFSAIYAVHGLGCALDWPARPAPVGDLHRFALISLWLASLMGGALILWRMPKVGDAGGRIARAGGWIGFLAILLTLFPVLGLTTCG
ncbi:hypothetical protein NM680_18275 [Paracoccus sp. PS-1]|uniref:hypothetical protein n=1 Tax=Paracoccus sp. PS1 TaxID=2963938 RepID=UPI0027E4729C|nr:hypothetical protein [Paracoccus sp. PS1]MDQ7263745.1 hypothetical protein [Paracoccus sp. PS1]